MSLRGAFAATKQSPVRGDCFAAARNDRWAKVNALQELQSASGEELRPLFWADVDAVHFGQSVQR